MRGGNAALAHFGVGAPVGGDPRQGSSADGGRSLAMQEVVPQDLTPPPPEKEFGFFFHVKEGVGRGNHSPLSAILIAAACHHPSSSPTCIIFRVCLPQLQLNLSWGDKDFPPAATQVAHQKPQPCLEKLPIHHHINQLIQQQVVGSRAWGSTRRERTNQRLL